MIRFLMALFVAIFISVSAMAQSQYGYDPTKLTAEQQHMVERAKSEAAAQEKNKGLARYRDEARNPAKYKNFKTYGKERKSYR